MGRYFKALGTGDFARFFTENVTWTTIETGTEVRGPLAVQDAIVGLHAQMSDIKTRQLAVSEGAAYIEGNCTRADGTPGRISYCVAYDLDGDRIASMRAYGALGAIMPIERELMHRRRFATRAGAGGEPHLDQLL